MKKRNSRFRFLSEPVQGAAAALLCLALFFPVSPVIWAQQQAQPAVVTTTTTTEETPLIPADELDSLVAPIALYPDPLLAQTLAASTYPLEIVQLQQWMENNKDLKDKALADSVAKKPWDASVQGLAAFPEVVTKLGDNIAWTSDLGNAFLAQQADVMAAVQRMRAKAQGTGALKTSSQQVVETQTIEDGKQAIVIQPASPDVVYVPSYDPVVVYGASYPSYPYPPVYYPGYVAGAGLAFGAGLALGAAWGGGWGYGCGWGRGDVNINYNNKYVNNSNKNFNQNNKWGHNPQHRGSVPYGNRQTANKYGGTARGQGRTGGRQPGGGAGALPLLGRPAVLRGGSPGPAGDPDPVRGPRP
jgi:hypothetical protein